MPPTLWQETITRGAVIALMNNFTSVAEALKELVDNPIDYRYGQSLEIDISLDKRRDRLLWRATAGEEWEPTRFRFG